MIRYNRIGPGKRVNGKSGKAETTIFGHITRGSAGRLALTVIIIIIIFFIIIIINVKIRVTLS